MDKKHRLVEEAAIRNELSDFIGSFGGKHLSVAKHFFELGKAKASTPLSWEDMRNLHIIFESIDVEIELSQTDIKKETIDYYLEVLKRFKAQKGE